MFMFSAFFIHVTFPSQRSAVSSTNCKCRHVDIEPALLALLCSDSNPTFDCLHVQRSLNSRLERGPTFCGQQTVAPDRENDSHVKRTCPQLRHTSVHSVIWERVKFGSSVRACRLNWRWWSVSYNIAVLAAKTAWFVSLNNMSNRMALHLLQYHV